MVLGIPQHVQKELGKPRGQGGIFRVWSRCPGSVCLGLVRLPWDHAMFVSPCSQVSGTAGKPRDALMPMGEGRWGAGAARRRSSC